MNKYNKAIIYKIEHVSNPELCYIGGTTNFNARKAQHKSRTLNPNDKEHHGYKYKMIRENGGWDMFRMVALKNVNVNSKRELEMEEEQFRELYKAKMNAHKAYSDTGHKPSPEARLNSELNQALKLDKYRKENAEEIAKYKNDKIFLTLIKKKKYTLADYKENLPEGSSRVIGNEVPYEVTVPTFTTLQNEVVDGHNGFTVTTINFDGDVGRVVDLEKESLPQKKRGRPKKSVPPAV